MWPKFIKIMMLLLLGGTLVSCASTSARNNDDQKIPHEYVVLMEPYTPTEELQNQEIAASQMLYDSKLTQVEKSDLFVQRAEIEQRLGLRFLAMLNLMAAIRTNSENALAYLQMAGLLADEGRFLEAYDAYDAAIELSPKHDNVYLYRSIALYYGQRVKMAYEDLKNFYMNARRDPYAILWLYILEHELQGAQEAQANLQERYRFIPHDNNSTFTRVIRVILGLETEKNLWLEVSMSAHDLPAVESLCELYFFLGKYHQLLGHKEMAQDYFMLSMQTNVVYFVEYACAKQELRAAKFIPEKVQTSDPNSASM